MVTQQNKQLIESYFAAVSGQPKPPSLVARFVNDAELAHHIALFEEAFPAYELIAEDMIAEDDKVAVRATFRGIQQHAFNGIPPTNKAAEISVMLIYRIANGKIVQHWMNADSLSLLQQIGALPTPS